MIKEMGEKDLTSSAEESGPRLLLPADPGFAEIEEQAEERSGLSRRTVLRLGALGVAGVTLAGGRALAESYLGPRGLMTPDGVFAGAATALTDAVYEEVFPTSPLILSPFSEPLVVPKAAVPVAKSVYSNWADPPGPGAGQQNSLHNERHQIWTSDIGSPDPIVYKFDLRVAQHSLTHSDVLAIDKNGRPVPVLRRGRQDLPGRDEAEAAAEHHLRLQRGLPRPDDQRRVRQAGPGAVRQPPGREPPEPGPSGLRHQGLLVPDPPAQRPHRTGERRQPALRHAPRPPARGLSAAGCSATTCTSTGRRGEPAEATGEQATSWYRLVPRPGRVGQTAHHVHKDVLVQAVPDTIPRAVLDMGDERQGLHLPGVRTDNPDGSFDVAYDIPLAFCDFRLDDGVTVHKDIHDTEGEFPDAHNPKTAPAWVGHDYIVHQSNRLARAATVGDPSSSDGHVLHRTAPARPAAPLGPARDARPGGAGRALARPGPRPRPLSDQSPTATGRSGSWLYCDQEPGNRRPGPKPASSSDSRLWQAVTPDPQ